MMWSCLESTYKKPHEEAPDFVSALCQSDHVRSSTLGLPVKAPFLVIHLPRAVFVSEELGENAIFHISLFGAEQVNLLTLSKTELESQRRRPRECVPTDMQYASTARLRSFSPKEAWHNE